MVLPEIFMAAIDTSSSDPYRGGCRVLFYATQSGGAINLGSIGGNIAMPFGVSNTGKVVGWGTNAAGVYHAFVYANGTMVDLNSLATLTDGAYFTQATAINDRGQLVVQASDSLTYLFSPPVGAQLADVLTTAMGVGAGNNLLGKLTQAQAYYGTHDKEDACGMLKAFASEAKALAGKVIANGLSLELVADAQGLIADMGCSD
jgi:probable HAF family extracellular repeat protein